jgi:hypothetical protein
MVHGRAVVAIVKSVEENGVDVVEFKRPAVFEREF